VLAKGHIRIARQLVDVRDNKAMMNPAMRAGKADPLVNAIEKAMLVKMVTVIAT